MTRHARARTDVAEMEADISESLRVLRAALQPVDGTPEDTAMCEIETFVAVAIRVFTKTNPSKIRSEAMTLEIHARMNGIPVLQGSA